MAWVYTLEAVIFFIEIFNRDGRRSCCLRDLKILQGKVWWLCSKSFESEETRMHFVIRRGEPDYVWFGGCKRKVIEK